MIIISSAFKCFNMSRVRFCLFDPVLAVSLCCFALLVEAEAQITDPSEVDALQAIKYSLIDREENLKSWNKSDPCIMKWTGVLCSDTRFADGYLHVQELQLFKLNLSGSLAPELGRLSYLTILDFMWNEISGSIPKEIGQIKSLKLLLLNGNKLSGSLPDELGYLPNLTRIQVDENYISGPLPKSFANLEQVLHLHMNNNSISGEIPTELSRLPVLIHLLLDNNNLSGNLPSELSQLPGLQILQLDNNNFNGSVIPASYGNMSKLLKLDSELLNADFSMDEAEKTVKELAGDKAPGPDELLMMFFHKFWGCVKEDIFAAVIKCQQICQEVHYPLSLCWYQKMRVQNC